MIGTPQDPRVLAKLFGVDLDNPTKDKTKAKAKGNKAETTKSNKAQTNGQAQTKVQPRAATVDLSQHPRVLKALELRSIRLDGTPDRSADAHRVARACLNAGLTVHACEAVMRERVDLGDWLDENPANEVARSYAKFERDNETTSTHLRERLLKLSDLKSLVPAKPLIRGLLYQDTLAQIAGAPGSYKSFIAVGMMCSLATGLPLCDFEVPRKGKAVYVAAEGASGIRKRLLAWCEHHGVNPEQLDENLLILPTPLQLGRRDQVSQMIDIVGEFGADMLALDTRARCTVGLEENSATDQGKAIDAADRIRDATRCTPLGIHHSPRTGTAGRGSNAWDGAVWSDLRVEGSHQVAKLHCEKHKDIPDGCDHHFSFPSHVVSSKLMPGIDLEGRSTLVLSRGGSGQTGQAVLAWQVLLDIIQTTAPVDGFSPTQIVAFAMEREIARSTAFGALKVLVDMGRIENIGTQKRAKYVAVARPENTHVEL
jgi:hypothetical protein